MIADQQDDNPDSAFWQARELINKSHGATTPLFLTQGYLEDNTKQDGAYSYFNGMAGPKHAWFGPPPSWWPAPLPWRLLPGGSPPPA